MHYDNFIGIKRRSFDIQQLKFQAKHKVFQTMPRKDGRNRICT